MRGFASALPLIFLLSACAAPPPAGPGADMAAQTRAVSSSALFGAPRPYPAARPNSQIAQDILELGFRLESGRALERFSRFEGPVTLRLTGALPPLAVAETDRLIARLRREARIDIRRTPDAQANLIVEFVPRASLRRAVPNAACFVLPNVTSWDEYRANPRNPALDWAAINKRNRALIVVPADVSVQEMRDCLHEEIAQAMGPLNDLYRIGETVWNDDNFQTTLTGFDMLVLRVWNDPALQSGMTKAEVAERLPRILSRLNPAGGRVAAATPGPETPLQWVAAIEASLGAPSRRSAYLAARRALSIAAEQGWQDERLAFALFLSARFAPPDEGREALEALSLAGRIYASRPGAQAQRAHVDLHMSAQALAVGQTDVALRLTERGMDTARRTENGALLASLMLVRAQAFERAGQTQRAAELRRDVQPFAIFGFGSAQAALSRQQEIASLGGRPRDRNEP
jgi:hypothetical protein